MPIHIGDYKRDTGHLRAAEHGAYLLLLFHHWSTGALPTDDRQLASIACMSPAEWKRAKPILVPFFDDGWVHGRVIKDLQAANEKYEKLAGAGKRGGEAKARLAKKPSQASQTVEANPSDALATDYRLPIKKDSEPNGSGAEAPSEDPSQAERDYFARGRKVLGKSAGGQLAKLLKANGGNVALSRSTLELAATKHDPAAFFARAVAPVSQGPPAGKGGFTSVLMDKHMERQNGTSDNEPEFSEH